MLSKVEFPIIGGGNGLIASLGSEDMMTLKIGGALLPLGERDSWSVEIVPFPHAWRISFSRPPLPNPFVWFDVIEKDAMNIEQFIENVETVR